MTPAEIVRYCQKIVITDGCWYWIASVDPNGYGVATLNGRRAYAHVFAYLLWIARPIPDDMVVHHTCHTKACKQTRQECPHRRCVNPAHLALSTRGDNVRAGNAGWPKGKKNPALARYHATSR